MRPKIIIPPKQDATISSDLVLRERNRHIRSIDKVGPREWEKKSGYSKRSSAENSIFRYKAIIGKEMRARALAGQRVEARIGCRILNTMASLGMPESELVE